MPACRTCHRWIATFQRPRGWSPDGFRGIVWIGSKGHTAHDQGGTYVRGGRQKHDSGLRPGTEFLREEAIPRLSQTPGFVSGHWVRLGETSGASMLIFETEEAARTAKERFEANPPPMVSPMSLEVGEVQEHAP